MRQRKRRGFTAAEKTELWDRWQRGESLKGSYAKPLRRLARPSRGEQGARSFDAFPVLGLTGDPPTGGAGGAGLVPYGAPHTGLGLNSAVTTISGGRFSDSHVVCIRYRERCFMAANGVSKTLGGGRARFTEAR